MTSYLLSVATLAAVFSFATLSLNLQYGLTGLVNFGQIAFVGVGAYCVGVAVFQGVSLWVGAAIAPVMGGLLGLALAAVGRRLRQDYWALMTLGVAVLFTVLLENNPGLAGGTNGVYGIPAPFSTMQLLVVLGALLVITLAVLERLRRSQFGRVLRAIREDPQIVASVGRDTARYEAAVMVLGGAIASLSGVAYAVNITYLSPGAFSLNDTFVIWIAMIVGGVGNNLGAIVGIVVIEAILAGILFLPGSGEVQAITGVVIEGLLLITVMLLRPKGLIPEPLRRLVGPGSRDVHLLLRRALGRPAGRVDRMT